MPRSIASPAQKLSYKAEPHPSLPYRLTAGLVAFLSPYHASAAPATISIGGCANAAYTIVRRPLCPDQEATHPAHVVSEA